MDINKLKSLKLQLENDMLKLIGQNMKLMRKREGVERETSSLDALTKKITKKDGEVDMYAKYCDIVSDLLNDYTGGETDSEIDIPTEDED